MSVLHEYYLKRTLSLNNPQNPKTNMSWKHHSGRATSSRELTWLLERLLELQQLLPFWRQENTKGLCRYNDPEPSLFAKPTSGFPNKAKEVAMDSITSHFALRPLLNENFQPRLYDEEGRVMLDNRLGMHKPEPVPPENLGQHFIHFQDRQVTPNA
jgi:hypothetical protein